jgi:beta-xylosidase
MQGGVHDKHEQTSRQVRRGRRQVDPGEVELRVGRSSTDIETTLRYTLTGQRRQVGFGRALHPDITLLPAD